MALEKVVESIVKRLKKEYSNKDIYVSNNLKGEKIHIKEADGNAVKYLSKPNKRVIFQGIEVPKHSWHKVSNFYRTSYNAGVIELCKSIPYFPHFDVKNTLLKSTGIKLGKDVTIAPRVQFDYFYPQLISIGDNTLIGDAAKLWTHEYGPDYFAIGEIKIGKNCYIGSEAIVGPGEIKDNTKIKACSLIINGKDFNKDL